MIDTSSFNNEIKCLGSGIIHWKGDDTHVSNLLTWVGSSSLGVSNSIKRPNENKIKVKDSIFRVIEDSNETHRNTTVEIGDILN